MIDSNLFDELLNQTDESSTLEFKREIRLTSDKEKLEFAKDVTAIANTEGGYLIFGKEDKRHGGQIVGIDPNTFDSDQMQQIIAQRCYPPPVFKGKLIKHNSKFFAILEIPESNSKPIEISKTRAVWVRRDGITDRATQKEREKMVLESDKKSQRPLTLTEELEMEGIHEEPESVIRKFVIKIGRWYALRTYGQLDVPLRKEVIILAIVAFLLFTPLVYTFFQISSTKAVPNNSILVISVILALVGILPILGIETLVNLRCPKCNRNFGVRRTEHIRVKDKILSKLEDRVIREVTYRNTYTCDYCGHTETKFQNIEETIRTK